MISLGSCKCGGVFLTTIKHWIFGGKHLLNYHMVSYNKNICNYIVFVYPLNMPIQPNMVSKRIYFLCKKMSPFGKSRFKELF